MRAVERLLRARRVRRIEVDDLRRLRVPLAKVLPFVSLPGHHPGTMLDSDRLVAASRPAPHQASLFAPEPAPGSVPTP